ncbi:glycosyltransferase family 4 protein [Marinilabilia rubra]|uniref:glycosyltransferase family 4 protein n=1 Tax=Marinilabilia rubra TaxID=2162893 RepID=UPI0021CEB926|nr:glycosyltransferase family 4 protein [Marinilabilia rubra]
MRVLFVHNRYKQAGGEDSVVKMESQMLKRNGHDVELLEFDNTEIKSFLSKIKTFFSVIYSKSSKKGIRRTLENSDFDLIHVHNFFPLISPSIYDLANEYDLPVVQTLHNYRIICPGALLMKNSKVCEKCITGNYMHSVLYRCYRKSFFGSLSLAMMDYVNRKRNTWNTKIDKVICLTEFAKSKFIEGGISEDLITVKPNFIEYRGDNLESTRENLGLFVGRLSHEKGIAKLIQMHDYLDGKVLIVGDGPLINKLKGLDKFIVYGKQNSEQVNQLMKKASFLIFPSIWYEGLPMTIIEAFSNRLPVVASKLGAMKEIIKHEATGLLFNLIDLQDGIDNINRAFNNFALMRDYGNAAYCQYLNQYTDKVNLKQMLEIYKEVLEKRKNCEE